MLLAQQQAGRLPDFFPLGQAAPAPGQGAAEQPAPGGGAGQAGPMRPRLQTCVSIAKVPPLGWLSGARPPQAGAKAPPPEAAGAKAPPAAAKAPPLDAAGPPGLQRDPPFPTPAAGQDSGADWQPQGGDAEAPAGGQGGAGPSEAGLPVGDPDSDAPGALTGRLFLPGAAPPQQPPGAERRGEGDFFESDFHTPTDVESGEESRVASQALREQDEEAKAALAMAEQVPVPGEAEGDLLAGGSAGAEEWLEARGPGPRGPRRGGPGVREAPAFPGQTPPFPVTPEDVYKGVKVEPEEGKSAPTRVRWRMALRRLPRRFGAFTLGETRLGGAPPSSPGMALPGADENSTVEFYG